MLFELYNVRVSNVNFLEAFVYAVREFGKFKSIKLLPTYKPNFIEYVDKYSDEYDNEVVPVVGDMDSFLDLTLMKFHDGQENISAIFEISAWRIYREWLRQGKPSFLVLGG